MISPRACAPATGVRSPARSRWSRTATRSSYDLVRELYPETGSAFVVGVTGPPGVGKSSLISALVRHVREADRTVGVISVDPSSPFTHGALLGDRIRLSDHFLDPGVFIRSMGTRGHLGGLVGGDAPGGAAPRRGRQGARLRSRPSARGRARSR